MKLSYEMSSSNEKFSQIYDQYVEKIYRFIYLKVNSQEVTEDITSNVFLKGWESYQKNQESIKNIGAFLYQIARNMVIDHYREKGRTKVASVNLIPQIIDTKINLYEKAVLASDIEIIKSAMQNIKKDYQDVLILHYLEDMATEDIADVLNKPVGTIRVMIHRGLEALKGELRGEA